MFDPTQHKPLIVSSFQDNTATKLNKSKKNYPLLTLNTAVVLLYGPFVLTLILKKKNIYKPIGKIGEFVV